MAAPPPPPAPLLPTQLPIGGCNPLAEVRLASLQTCAHQVSELERTLRERDAQMEALNASLGQVGGPAALGWDDAAQRACSGILRRHAPP